MDRVLFSSNSVEWETPLPLFNDLNNEFHFNFDLCANDQNHKCDSYFTIDDDSLCHDWSFSSCWLNPPYSRSLGKWVRKAYFSHLQFHNTIVLLIPARTDTSYFHDYILGKAEIRFIRGRLHFNNSKSSAPFPSMICIFRGDANV